MSGKKLTPAAVPCGVAWCVCLALTDGRYCAVHREQGGEYRPLELEPGDVLIESSIKGDCDSCNGTGVCSTCEGKGWHLCGECSDKHDCGHCDGDKECCWCNGTGWSKSSRRNPAVRKVIDSDLAYLRFNFDPGLVPLPPAFDRPWDTA